MYVNSKYTIKCVVLYVYTYACVHVLRSYVQYSSSVTLRVLARLERVTRSWLASDM